MRRKGILSLAIVIGLVVASLVVPVVLAKGNPRLRDRKLGWRAGSLIAEGDVVGLANEEYGVGLRAIGFAPGICVNPGGNEEVQGRNPISVEADVRVDVDTEKNGKASFTLEAVDPASADIPPSPTPKEAGCPNGNWTVYIAPRSTDWTEAWLFLYATDGTLLDSAYYTCVTTFGDPITVECTLVK